MWLSDAQRRERAAELRRIQEPAGSTSSVPRGVKVYDTPRRGFALVADQVDHRSPVDHHSPEQGEESECSEKAKEANGEKEQEEEGQSDQQPADLLVNAPVGTCTSCQGRGQGGDAELTCVCIHTHTCVCVCTHTHTHTHT